MKGKGGRTKKVREQSEDDKTGEVVNQRKGGHRTRQKETHKEEKRRKEGKERRRERNTNLGLVLTTGKSARGSLVPALTGDVNSLELILGRISAEHLDVRRELGAELGVDRVVDLNDEESGMEVRREEKRNLSRINPFKWPREDRIETEQVKQ